MFSNKVHSSYILLFTSYIIVSSCSVQKQIARSANIVIKDPSTAAAHIGISIFEPADNKYRYNYQADKYFVPASNTKIPTCYAAMKYLGDSLVAVSYSENDTALFINPAGDPTLLHPDFKKQPVVEFLQKVKKKIYISDKNWETKALGAGWSWDDYNDSYMPERSALPVYGNMIKWVQTQTLEKSDGFNEKPVSSVFSEPEIDWEVNFNADNKDSLFFVQRKVAENSYTITEGKEKYKEQNVPFVTNGLQSALELLKDTAGKETSITLKPFFQTTPLIIHSQPVDSLLKPMMHNSDNFFAEQTLLMVSNKLLGVMSDEKITDTLLKTDLKDLPQKPNWADGSGLSRYNLFTPQDFIFILRKMKDEFGMKRIQAIFPTGGTGALENRYKTDSGYIFAKTGTLSGVVSLSGYLYTKKNRLFLFSVLVNNHKSSGMVIRNAIEKFLAFLRNKY